MAWDASAAPMSRAPATRWATRPVHRRACRRCHRDSPCREPTRRHGIVADVAAAVTTAVTELGDSRVRLLVHVPAVEVEDRLERKAQQLGRDLKLAGFRRGKVPAPLVIQRVGREAVLEEAVRETLSSWYAQAVAAAAIVPVGDPDLALEGLPGRGEDLAFSVEVGVVPKARLGEYRGLEVPRREPHAGEDEIDREIEGVRERLARLQTATRPAQRGDFVVIDYVGSIADGEAGDEEPQWERFAGGEGRDQLVELGTRDLIPGFEEGLIGAAAGQTRTIRATFPPDYGAAEFAGREASFEVTVKEVKLKVFPAVDEDLAIDAGFDDLDELRQDIRCAPARRRRGALVAQEFRQAALDAAAAAAEVAVPPGTWPRRRAGVCGSARCTPWPTRGISREGYLQLLGRGEAELLEGLEEQGPMPEPRSAARR